MSTLYIIGVLGIPAAVAAIVTAVINYRGGIRNLYTQYELEQQRELRALMGAYTGRMLEAAIDWDRRMMQLYEYWREPDDDAPKQEGYDPDIGWHMMCPGWWEGLNMRWPARTTAMFRGWRDRLEKGGAARAARAVAERRRDPSEYFYLSVVFRFLSLLAIARRFEAEAFYLDSLHLKNHANELYFLRYAKGFLWTATHSSLSPDDGLPARDHFLSDKLRPMLDLCYKELGPADSKAPKGQPIFDWDRFLALINRKTGPNNEYDPDIDQLLEFFYALRPVDYTAGNDGEVIKRRRWERLICLHLLTLNFIATFGFPWQRDIEERRAMAIDFLSMDNTVIDAFVEGTKEWLGLEDQDHMKSLCDALRRAYKETQDISHDAMVRTAARRLVGMGAEMVADPAVLRDKAGNQFRVDKAWLENVQWRKPERVPVSKPEAAPASRLFRVLAFFRVGPFPGPGAGELAGSGRGAAVERGLHHREDGALERRGDQDLGPAAAGVGCRRSFVLARRHPPDLLEDRAGDHTAKHADQHADRLIQQLAHDPRLPGAPALTRRRGPQSATPHHFAPSAATSRQGRAPRGRPPLNGRVARNAVITEAYSGNTRIPSQGILSRKFHDHEGSGHA
jgi:hypothetical protein